MSDAPSWVAVGVSVAALAWTAWVDYRTRKEARRATAREEQAVIDGAISRVVANWAATRLKEVTFFGDPNLEKLKESAHRWRDLTREPLAAVPATSRVYELINQTVKAVSEFEAVIDPMREEPGNFNPNTVQNALTRMQSTVWESINQLNTLKGSNFRGTS